MKQLFALSILAALAACGTIEGMGKDIESVGNAIEEEAKD
ncbi:MAG: entericidin A/B family lipoprotein [Alphaproteobacteria bacterium]|nr:entericidin A/B family lipoprotein [Alphaproteobacteria bacterium]